MLDMHAMTITPGAALVLGAVASTVAPGNDGQSVAGVPIADGAQLVRWGGLSPTADTIAAIKLASQDMVDSINGEYYVPGAASLLNVFHEVDNLPYKTGQRMFQMGTNTGVVAGSVYTIDRYAGGNCVRGSRNMPRCVVPMSQTFGAACTSNTWNSQAFTPPVALPSGKYAILGALVSAIANGALLRFSHADFGGKSPGFPVHNYETISTATWDKSDKSPILSELGTQFVAMGDEIGEACCPVFSVTSGGTGLTMQVLSVQADTPVVTPVLAKVA